MSIFNTGLQIFTAFRNASRAKKIVLTFAHHGFAEIISKIGLGNFSSKEFNKSNTGRSTPERLKLAFEELGPTFIKLGQLLAGRPDLLPDDFIQQFLKLQDEVQAIPYKQIEGILKSSLGDLKYAQLAHVNPTPLGSGSIAQVHLATQLSGSKIVLKVRKPSVLVQIRDDISILKTICELLNKYIPEVQNLQLTEVIHEFEKTLLSETDLELEANNIKRFQKNFYNHPNFVIPMVHPEFSTSEVLALDYIEGQPLSKITQETQQSLGPDFLKTSLDIFVKMIFRDGYFHGDLHPGNFFILPDKKVGLVDFGIVGRLSPRLRNSIIRMLNSLINEDYEQLAFEYTLLSSQNFQVNSFAFARDLQDLISPIIGLSNSSRGAGHILLKSASISNHHGVRLPPELLLFFKALIGAESIGNKLDSNFDLVTFALDYIKENKSEVIKDSAPHELLTSYLLETSHLAKEMPKLLYSVLRRVERADHSWKLNFTKEDQLSRSLLDSGKRISNSIFLVGIIIFLTLNKKDIFFNFLDYKIGIANLLACLALGLLILKILS